MIPETTANVAETNAIENINMALNDTNLKAHEKHDSISQIVVNVLRLQGHFYHANNKLEFGSVYYFDNDKKSLVTVQSDEFQAGISERFGINMASIVFKYVLAECETVGLSKRSKSIKLSKYWEMSSNKIYISNSPGTMIRITRKDIKIVDNGTDGVLFPNGSTLEPWEYNQDGAKDPFQTCELFNTMSVQEPYMETLFKVWVCSHPTNPQSKPPLCATGDIGSGKTRLLMGLHELWGTPGSPAKCQYENKGEEDFWILVDRGGFLLLDNVDNKIPWLADALATYSTGGSSEKRTLRTNSGITKLDSNSWCGLTSANPKFAADAGLSDRLLVIRLNRRTGETKEMSLKNDIKLNRSGGLSWICQILSKSLADNKPVPNKLNARHPDFAEMAVRIGRQFDQEKNIVDALKWAEKDKSTFNMENDDIGVTIKEYFEQNESDVLTGDANDIVKQLKEINPELWGSKHKKELTARGFGNRLKTILPHLETLYRAESPIGTGNNKRVYSFFRPGSKKPQRSIYDEPKKEKITSEMIEKASIEWNLRKQADRGQAVITALLETRLTTDNKIFGITDSSFGNMNIEQQEAITNYYITKGVIEGCE